ncbi:cell wall metabolism sensor histidine kinase WalK [Paenibacillus sp. OV219]|uniref:sensor histidine kinase n=1 Tax=Paenibacillus sp. OV219 TaxID=1884377 RepID=UPI0008AD7713|nr:HAMP domain-containing sensor histidine kinase [Paenibacillus sp. OV219]SEM53924.1 Signal transduction histidine kinase [Paenibacillus sp. OV219]
MSIRMKLLLSYAAMLIIPLISIILISVLMVVFYQGDLQNIKGLYESTEDSFDHGDVEHIAKEIRRSVEREPDLLKDRDYLNEMTTELKEKDAGLVVRLGDTILYRSASIQQLPQLTEGLPPFKMPETFSKYPVMKIANADYFFLQFDFDYPKFDKGTVFIISKIDPMTFFIRKYFPSLFIALLCVLILTHILLTTFMSTRIIRPLQVLRKAAREIKEGNLDFQVDVIGKDEIGQLGVAFEEMRSRLQHSIEVQALYEANRKELISNISHDLKTPLTAIKGYVDGIMEGVADTPEKYTKYMQTIAIKADELDYLINELFLYSKLDLNREPFRFETVQLEPYLSDWSEELQFELEKLRVSYSADITIDSETDVLLDWDHFKRVLNNIIQNSVRYTDKDEPVISLKAYCEEENAIIHISDNGIGIEPEALEHIFERFYRAEESRNSNTGGSGLGLAIAKQIMDGHGGTISATSQPNIGTTITLQIPIWKGSNVQS